MSGIFPFSDDAVDVIVKMTQNVTPEDFKRAVRADPIVKCFGQPLPDNLKAEFARRRRGAGLATAVSDGDEKETNGEGDGADKKQEAEEKGRDSPVPMLSAEEEESARKYLIVCELQQKIRRAKAGAAGRRGSAITAATPISTLYDAVDASLNYGEVPEEEDYEVVDGKTRVVVATEPSAALADIMAASKATSTVMEVPISCVLIHKRDSNSGNSAGGGAGAAPARVVRKPLTARDLFIQSLDIQEPMESLQCILTEIYDPILQAKRNQVSVRNKVQELLSGIHAYAHVLPEINLQRFIQQDLLVFCVDNATLNVHQLLDRLGPQVKDPTYIRKVLNVRNGCLSVLPIDNLLLGHSSVAGDTAVAPGAAVRDRGSLSSASGVSPSQRRRSGAAGGDDNATSEEVGKLREAYSNSVSERKRFWEGVLIWIEDVQRQIRSREWQLVHAIVGNRAATDFSREYSVYRKQVVDYIAFLGSIPVKYLQTVSDTNFESVVDDIFAAALQPSAYPPKLLLRLMAGIVAEIATMWVQLTEKKSIIGVLRRIRRTTVLNNNTSNNNNNDPLSGTTKKNKAGGPEVGDEVVALRMISSSFNQLTYTQQKYTESCELIAKNNAGLLHAELKGSLRHPLIEALSRRCSDVRMFIERHFGLMRQLRTVFITKEKLVKAGELIGGLTDNADSGISLTRTMVRRATDVSSPGEMYTEMLEAAFDEAVRRIVINDGGSGAAVVAAAAAGQDGASAPQRADRGGGNLNSSVVNQMGNTMREPTTGAIQSNAVLWQVGAEAQYVFDDAVRYYSECVRVCDEQVAALATQLLVTAQQTGSGDMRRENRGVGLFRVYANLRFLSLERVQKVVKGYRSVVTQTISQSVKQTQELFFNISEGKKHTLYNASRYNLSNLVSYVMWQRHLESCLRNAVLCRDYVLDHGWHELLSLRNVEYLWRLDARLAAFFGIPFEYLVTSELVKDSTLHGTAYAIAFLKLIFPEDEVEWSADPYFSIAVDLVTRSDASIVTTAKDRLVGAGAANVTKGDRDQQREIRMALATIVKQRDEKVLEWCEAVQLAPTNFPYDPNTMNLQGPILRIVTFNEADGTTAVVTPQSQQQQSAPGSDALTASSSSFEVGGLNSKMAPFTPLSFLPRSGSGPPSPRRSPSLISRNRRATILSTGAAAPGDQLYDVIGDAAAAAGGGGGGGGTEAVTLLLDVAFPWEFSTLASDLRYLESGQMLRGGGGVSARVPQIGARVREFIRANEKRWRIATTLLQLIRVYYVTVHGEDESLVLLATEEYHEVNELFVTGLRLNWSSPGGGGEDAANDAALVNYLAELAAKLDVFVTAVSRVREKTEIVARRIRGFHERPFHPEAIALRVREIRKVVSSLSLHCVNAYHWIKRTQPLLDAALCDQIHFLAHGWTMDFQSMRDDTRFLDPEADTDVFHIRPLRVRMQVIYKEVRMESPPSAWRVHWIGELARFFGWVEDLPRLYDESDAEVHTEDSRDATLAERVTAAVRSGKSDESYLHLLAALPTRVVAEPLRAIEECIQEAAKVEQEWKGCEQLLHLDVAFMQQRFENDLNRWNDTLSIVHEMTDSLMDYTQPNKVVGGGIVVVADEAQMELGRKVDQMCQYMYNKFKDLLGTELEAIHERLEQEFVRVDNYDVISSIPDAAQFLSESSALQKQIDADKEHFSALTKSEDNLRQMGYEFPQDWIFVESVYGELTEFCEMFERKLKALSLRRQTILDKIVAMAEELDAKVRALDDDLEKLDSEAIKTNPAVVRAEVQGFAERGDALDEEAVKLIATQKGLDAPAYDRTHLDSLRERIRNVLDCFNSVGAIYTKLRRMGEVPFFELVPRRQHEELQEIEAEITELPEVIRAYPQCQDLKTEVRRLLSLRRLMQDLRSDSMSPLARARPHWVSLRDQLKAPWVLENLTVRDIWNSDPTSNMSIYNEVLDVAEGERRIEVQLQQITDYWDSFEFELSIYKKQVALVRGWDDLFDRLTDDLSTFGGIRASPYFVTQQLISQTNDLENLLNRLRQVLEALMEVQKRWVYLDDIFSGNAEIRQQLPRETTQYERVSRELVHLLPKLRTGGVLPIVRAQFFTEDEKMLPTLERLLQQLIAVQRALTAYLDTQRMNFPRFFFVGDEDLLEILANSKDPVFMSRHLRKMFTALSSFLLRHDNDGSADNAIVGFASHEGEEVHFENHTSVDYRSLALYDWLNAVERGMMETLRELTVRASGELLAPESKGVTLEWMRRYPAQNITLALQIWWVRRQEELFLKHDIPSTTTLVTSPTPSEASQQQKKGLFGSLGLGGAAKTKAASLAWSSPATEAMDAILATLAEQVLDTSLAPSVRHRCEQLITVSVYQRDVSRMLVRQQIQSAADYQWSSVLRVYVTDTQTVECRMADAVMVHGFEYIGIYDRLVQTPLTDRCYLTLMQALHTRLGGSPVGPAGTGKTETVKALGMQLGRHVLVFNCDEAFDFQAMSRIFRGLCQVGAWGCFDEFNRLDERILSALSQQIQVIQEALRTRSNVVELNDAMIPLNENMGIVVTMNPGYAGRSNMPGNLKQLFRTVTMSAPDRETIAEVMLFAQGFQCAEALSLKVVPLFRLCEDQCSRQKHYDFGLRALKSVLVAAGVRKRKAQEEAHTASTGHNSFLTLDDDSPTRQQTSVNEEDAETEVVLQSIIATIAPKLITQDVALFYPLLRDFFPGRSMSSHPMREICAAIQELCDESRLTAVPGWVEKICQLLHTKDTRHGIMIVGPSGTGKTTAWKMLMAAMVKVNSSLEMQAYVIEPKVLTKQELFGHLDITTREWKDGVFTSILRKIIDQDQSLQSKRNALLESSRRGGSVSGWDAHNNSNSNRTQRKLTDTVGSLYTEGTTEREYWIIFDGDVDPEWVENLNSVLDDNKLLTLPNGERLPLPSSVRIIFEVQDLLYATPATVSRCGMIWFSEGVVPLPAILSHAYGCLCAGSVVDHRGRRDRCYLDDEFIGVATPGETRLLGDTPLTGVRGKTYAQYVLSAATEAATDLLMTSRRPTNDPDVLYASSSSSAHDATGDPRTPMSEYNASANNSASPLCSQSVPRRGRRGAAAHPDALRIQDVMVTVWESAFERHGLLARAIQLLLKPNSKYIAAYIMAFNQLQVVQSVVALLHEAVWLAFVAEQEAGSETEDQQLEAIAEKAIELAVFWAVGSPMDMETRLDLAKELELAPELPTGDKSCTMLDVEVDYRTGNWKLVRDRVRLTEIRAEQVGANDTVIPTVDTCRHEDLLEAWLGAGRSAILCGPPGSGKTMSVTAVLNNSAEFDVIFLNFSSGTTVETIIKSLHQYCNVTNTAQGYVMRPSSGKKLIMFCDEINLPRLDQYGTQVALQFIRQIVERGGFYRPRDNVWVNLLNVQIVGACNPPTDAGRVALSARVLRWAPVLFVGFPSPESLLTIYSTYSRAILQFNETLRSQYASKLASAMVQTYHASQQQFTPILQPHYLYSPRELSRWSRAIYEGILTWDSKDKRELSAAGLVRLALHEGLRVFSDRLVFEDERLWTDNTIDKCFQSEFPDVPRTTYERPLLFSTLLTHEYTESPREELRTLLKKRLTAFCDEEMSVPLVVFDSMIDHVVRIDRVLRQPLGHVLIAGSSGVGKTIIARLVAWLGSFSVFWLKVHRDYSLEDFEGDLRGLLKRSGCKRERICFIFDESNILQPAFLEYMNSLLAAGEVPGLFEGDEWTELIQDIKDAINVLNSSRGQTGKLSVNTNHVNDDYVDLNDDQSLYRWFLQNIKAHLHVVFTINPASSEFSSRIVASPALFNRCTIDWFGDWDTDTLAQITRESVKVLQFTPATTSAFNNSRENVVDAIVNAISDIHQTTQEINEALRTRYANQGTFITPRHFSDFVTQFVAVYGEKQAKTAEELKHLRNGLAKLKATSDEVATQQAQLLENEKVIAESGVRAQSMLERIVSETDVTKKEKEAAEVLRQQLRVEQEKIAAEAKGMEKDLAEAEPALKEAEAALGTVKPDYLREIRAYATPPPMVKRVLEAVLSIMGEPRSGDWDVLKQHIRRDDFLNTVKNFKPEDVTEESRARVRAMKKDKSFTIEAAYRASKAAGPLLQWVFAETQYSAIYERVAPIRAKIRAVEKVRDEKLAELNKTEKEIADKEAFLKRLKDDYQATTTKVATLKNNAIIIANKCDRASTIMRELVDERKRWEEEIVYYEQGSKTTLGDSILASAFLSYIGFFDEYTRRNILMSRWAQSIDSWGVSSHDPFVPSAFLVEPLQRLQWEKHGLVKDELCLENATIMDRAVRYTLLIDPSGTAATYLQNRYAEQKITKASFTRPGYLKQLELAVRFGYPIIMEDAENLDLALAPLLNNEYKQNGGRRITRIGALDVDMSRTFKLFLLTRDSNYQPDPGMAGQVCLVNFTITLSSLESQCLHQIILHERPDIDKWRSRLLELQSEYQLRQRLLEKKLLTTIADAKGSLLDDDQLIETLAELKEESSGIQQEAAKKNEAMVSIHTIERRYRAAASVSSRIFFALRRFNELSIFYQYEVQFIFRIIHDALNGLPEKHYAVAANNSNNNNIVNVPSTSGGGGGGSGGIENASFFDSSMTEYLELDAAAAEEEATRLSMLIDYIFVLAHRRASRGMFSDDHLVLALRLAQLKSAVAASTGGDANAAMSSPLSPDVGLSGGGGLRRASLTSSLSLSSAGGAGKPSAASPRTTAVIDVTSIAASEWDWLLESLQAASVTPGVSPREAAIAAVDASRRRNSFRSTTVNTEGIPPLLIQHRSILTNVGKHGQSALVKLLEKPAFAEMTTSLFDRKSQAAWEKFFLSNSPIDEASVLPSTAFPSGVSPARRLFLLTLLLFYTRRDNFHAAAQQLLSVYFDGSETEIEASQSMTNLNNSISAPLVDSTHPFGRFFSAAAYDLTDVTAELSHHAPLLLVLDGSYDPSPLVEQQAHRLNQPLSVVAMGSPESITTADACITRGMAKGGWVQLSNVHYASEYMESLEKRIHFQRLEGKLHEDFRLIMTLEKSAAAGADTMEARVDGQSKRKASVLPTNLLEDSVVVVFESSRGAKHALLQTYGTLARQDSQRSKTDDGYMERLYLAAAWVHFTVMERLVYVPLGWTQTYEYSDTEFLRVIQAVLAWTRESNTTSPAGAAAAGGGGGAPPTVSWVSLRAIISTTIYGGMVDSPFDQHVMNLFCERYLSARLFDSSVSLLKASEVGGDVPGPLTTRTGSGNTRAEVMKWIRSLPDSESTDPAWLLLPRRVSHLASSRRALHSLERLSAVQTVMREEVDVLRQQRQESTLTSSTAAGNGASSSLESLARARWVLRIKEFCGTWLDGLTAWYERLLARKFITSAVAAKDEELAEELLNGTLNPTTLMLQGEDGSRSGNSSMTMPSAGFTAGNANVVPPLVLAAQREVLAAVQLLRILVTDLNELREVCSGSRKPSSAHRALIENITRDHVPPTWAQYLPHIRSSIDSMLVHDWMSDVQQRAEHVLQLTEATESGELSSTCIAVGLLFNPGAYLTASKQQHARDAGVPLEQVVSSVTVLTEETVESALSACRRAPSGKDLFIGGVTLYSALVTKDGACQLSGPKDLLSVPVALHWEWKTQKSSGGAATTERVKPPPEPAALQLARQSITKDNPYLQIPFYVSDKRDSLLCMVQLPVVVGKPTSPEENPADAWYERGVALAAWSSVD